MKNLIQQFWSLIAVGICYALAMTVLVYGGPEGSENVPQWAYSLVTLVFTAIFLVGLQMALTLQASDSQRQEK